MQGPGTDVASAATLVSPIITATLERNGNEVIINGSVASLFTSGSFSGPNRAIKGARARLTPNGVTVSSGFEAARVAIAEQRAPQMGAAGGARSSFPPAIAAVQVASLDPGQSAALNAIDQIVPMAAPVPMTATPKLAYARETTAPSAGDLLVDKNGAKVSSRDMWCLATAIYFEARGESYRGQVAVGQVVMNRVAHKVYPNTICGVVYQNQQMRNACQFSFACDGQTKKVTEPKAWAQAQEIAKGVVNGSLYLAEVGAATHYHANYVYPDWAPRLKRLAKIGNHIFYQFKRAA